MRSQCILAIKLILLINLCTSQAGKDELDQENKGWLRICNGGDGMPVENYEVEAEKCPHGSWLSKSLSPGCVCLNGLWAISHGWCDEDYHLAYGRGHCFKIEKKIQKLAFLGNPENPFESQNFITKEHGHVFRSFSNEFHMPYEYARDTNRTLLRLKPDKHAGVLLEVHPDYWNEYQSDVYFKERERFCLDTNVNGDWSEDMLMIYKFKNGIKYIKMEEQCPTPKPSDASDLDINFKPTVHKLLPGQAIHMKNGKIIKASLACSSECQTPPSDSEGKLIRHKRQASSQSEDFEALQLDRDFAQQDRDAMVNFANLRVVKLELNWLLENIRPPTLNTQNWKLVRKMKEIFSKACGAKYVPKFLLDTMLRLFRLFYIHSKDFFPKGHVLEEFKQYGRINTVLDECLAEASPFTFEYNLTKHPVRAPECRLLELPMLTSDFKPILDNVTQQPKFIREVFCPCMEHIREVSVPYSLNLTGPVEQFNFTFTNFTLEEQGETSFLMPKQDRFNGTFHDFPTETVWKVINFVHYYCAKYFRFQPADHSALITKLEAMFNEDILFRWTRPGSNSNKVWQYLYSAFDLRKFAETMDGCVATAKYVSEYPEWINRPTMESRRRRKRSLDSEQFGSGSAFCLKDPWDPVNKLGVPVHAKCADLNEY